MKYILVFLIFTISIVTSNAWASAPAAIYEIQRSIQTEILALVRKTDPEAIVIAKVKIKKQKQVLPATPYELEFSILDEDNDLPVIERVEVKIFSNMKEIPKQLRELIDNVAASYGSKASISLKGVSEELLSYKNKSSFGLFLSKDENIFGMMGFSIFTIIISALMLLRNRASSMMQKTVEAGIGRLTEALENSKGSELEFDHKLMDQKSSPLTDESKKQLEGSISQMDSHSIVAVLTDAYWAKRDNYAAFIWNRTSLETKRQVREEVSFLKDYSKYLVGLGESSGDYHLEPYYLEPLALNQINNEDLTHFVRKHPYLLNHLPSLRSQSLNLTAKEKIFLMGETKEVTETAFNEIKILTPSMPRILSMKKRIQIQSLQEEQELLSLEGINADLREAIPSLGWAMSLKDQEIENILKSFSAQDLARAWIAPDFVLERFSKCLPEKKLNLLKSYLEKVKPNRENNIFENLHFLILQTLTPKSDTIEKEESRAA